MTGRALFWSIASVLAILPGALWYLTGDPIWAVGWTLLIVFGAAG